MTRESLFYKILSAIHIVLFTSILSFGMIALSGTLLMIPVLAATFRIGKDAIYKKLDITDSIIITFFQYLKGSLRKLIKFIPINLVLLLNTAGMLVAASENQRISSIFCLAIVSFLVVFMLYIAGYYSFVNEEVHMMDVILCMFIKLHYLISLFVVMLLCIFFFSLPLFVILSVTGSFFLFILEIVIFIQTLWMKKMLGISMEEEEYAYLIERQKKSH